MVPWRDQGGECRGSRQGGTLKAMMSNFLHSKNGEMPQEGFGQDRYEILFIFLKDNCLLGRQGGSGEQRVGEGRVQGTELDRAGG